VSDLDQVRADLTAERIALDSVLAALNDAAWLTPTPSPGWTVADQIGHLAYFDDAAATSISDPEGFLAHLSVLVAGAGAVGLDEFTLGSFRDMSSAQLLSTWRSHGAALDRAAAALADGQRVAWYGPAMSAISFVAARLMETWAHGTDVAEAVGAAYEPTSRLRHIARLGFATRRWSYTVRGEEPPDGSVRVDLIGPDLERWTWGEPDANDTVAGSAHDFCLVVTQRRHLDDTELVTGELGRHWLERAQVFAGTPSAGPPPGGRRVAG
jgi:uncharacterized protein (TIGR03084 family)